MVAQELNAQGEVGETSRNSGIGAWWTPLHS